MRQVLPGAKDAPSLGRRATTAAALRRVGGAVVVALPFLFLVAFALYPLGVEVVGSFYSWYQLAPATFVGLANYAQLFHDSVAVASILHSAIFLLATVPLEVALGFVAAWTTSRCRRGQAGLALVFILPLVVPTSSAVTLFLGVFGEPGTLNNVLHALGQSRSVAWLEHPMVAFVAIAALSIWHGTPWCFLLLLGALSAVPAEVLEAAQVDGARGLAYFGRVVLPSIRSTLCFVVVLRVLADGQTLTSVQLLTGGGPSFSTQLASTYAYELAFSFFQFGTACALASLLGGALVFVAVIGWRVAVSSRRTRHWHGLVEAALHALSPRPAPRRHRRVLPRRADSPVPATRARGRTALLAVLVVVTLLPFLGALSELGGAGALSLPWSAMRSGMWNSVLLTMGTLAGTLVLAIPAAHALARRRFRLSALLFVFVLFCLAIPGVVLILAQVREIAWFGLGNTRLGLVLLYVAANLPLAVVFLRPAMASVPDSLIEAMRIDGAPGSVIARRLMLPAIARTILAIAVLVAVWVWNESPLAIAVLNSARLFPMPELAALGVAHTGSLGTSWVEMIIPLLLFLLSQRALRRGLLSRAVL